MLNMLTVGVKCRWNRHFWTLGMEISKSSFFSIETNNSELQTRHCIILNGQILVKCAGGWLVKEGFVKS